MKKIVQKDIKHLKVGARLRIIITFVPWSRLLEVTIDGNMSWRSNPSNFACVMRDTCLLPAQPDPALGSMSVPVLLLCTVRRTHVTHNPAVWQVSTRGIHLYFGWVEMYREQVDGKSYLSLQAFNKPQRNQLLLLYCCFSAQQTQLFNFLLSAFQLICCHNSGERCARMLH